MNPMPAPARRRAPTPPGALPPPPHREVLWESQDGECSLSFEHTEGLHRRYVLDVEGNCMLVTKKDLKNLKKALEAMS